MPDHSSSLKEQVIPDQNLPRSFLQTQDIRNQLETTKTEPVSEGTLCPDELPIELQEAGKYML